MDIRLLQEKYQQRVKAIGFSGHHLGIAIDIGAYALGAQWIERHFTKDRTWKGTVWTPTCPAFSQTRCVSSARSSAAPRSSATSACVSSAGIGDIEHVLHTKGVSTPMGGCSAKTMGLNQRKGAKTN